MYFKPCYLKVIREFGRLSIYEMATRAKAPCESIKGVERGTLPVTDSIFEAYQSLLPTVDLSTLSIDKPFLTRVKAAIVIEILKIGTKLQG